MRFSFGAILLSVLLTSCGDDDGTSPGCKESSAVGTWTLQTVNGKPLPYLVPGDFQSNTELTSSTLTIAASGAWTESIVTRFKPTGQSTTSSPKGSWSYSGGCVYSLVESEFGTEVTWTLTGAKLSHVWYDETHVYARQ